MDKQHEHQEKTPIHTMNYDFRKMAFYARLLFFFHSDIEEEEKCLPHPASIQHFLIILFITVPLVGMVFTHSSIFNGHDDFS